MPRFRPEIAALSPYKVGRQLDDVARAHGLDPGDIVKLTANEGPEGPFPGVVEAAGAVLAESNRYPDNSCWTLGHALAEELGVDFSNLLFGAGSVALLTEAAYATGGPGTNIVYPWPSFIMYRFAVTWSGSEAREVPLDGAHVVDLDAMAEAVDSSTALVYLCNPNNPTGTINTASDIEAFIGRVPEDVLVVVDEAYHEFVEDDRYATAVPLALERPNVVVLRTFSKVFALAAHRVGYAVARADLIAELGKTHPPLSVTQVGQAAALATLGQPDELERRVTENAARRHHLVGALAERELDFAESHTNFIYFYLGPAVDDMIEVMTATGVLVRGMGEGWARVTVGDERDNRRFLEALDVALGR